MVNRNLKKVIAFCVLAASINSQYAKGIEKHFNVEIQNNDDKIGVGVGSLIYQEYKPLAHKPTKVWYYNPGKNDAQVLFVMHGNSRAAEGYFNAMLPHAKKHGVLLVVPEFDAVQYSSREYHQGGVLDKQGNLRKVEDWTFSIIEPIFDHFKKISGNTSAGYILYGFSAGSQFVHRFMMFNPDNRVIRGISGSAGTYTMPDYNISYSYGLKNMGVTQKSLNKFYAKNFMVIVGDADTVLSRPDLTKTPAANNQGRDRVERGQNFFKNSKAIAEQQNVPFNWKFQLIPGAGHSQGQMADPVAKILFDTK